MIGGGGHASVLVDILREQGFDIIAIISTEKVASGGVFSGIRTFASDDDIKTFSPHEVFLVNGVGMIPRTGVRKALFEKFVNQGYEFSSVVASNASVSPGANVFKGAQVLHGAVVQAGAIVQENSIINTGAIVEHDCNVGKNCHVATGAILCGGVLLSDDVFVGAGATVIQGLTIGGHTVIGAGSVVRKDIPTKSIVKPVSAEISRVVDQ